jgi:hypothetical protein
MRNRFGWWTLGSVTAVGILVAGLWAADSSPVGRVGASPRNLEDAYKKAQVDGKYRMLLRQIKVEKDAETYGAFKDFGVYSMPEYAGFQDLPSGHWVYVAPYWYIWRDLASVQRAKRNWGPEQATGEPDTDAAGDIVTAWASASQDGQEEWLMTEYENFVTPTAVLVHETYNPGALFRVTVFKPDGEEVEVWKGADPTPTESGLGVSEIPVKVNFKTNRVKIYLDSPSVPGWNEIDAVGLRDKAKTTQWAVAAEASSTYAPPYPPDGTTPPVAEVDNLLPVLQEMDKAKLQAAEKRIQKLENEVRALKDAVEDLKKGKNKDQ